MSAFNIPLKILRYLKKRKFIKEFKYCARSSGFGHIGYGEDCTIIGKENMSIGENSWFGSGCELYAYNSHFGQKLNSKLIVGNNVRVTARCRITCAGSIKIGNDVLIAPDVFITDHNHGTNPEIPGGYSKQSLLIENVNIEEGVWLGHRACILPGVTIGKHSIIGANSVVTHDIPEFCMAAGAPAQIIKRWNKEKQKWERE